MTAEPLTGRGWTARIDAVSLIIHLTGDWIARLDTGAEPGAVDWIVEAMRSDGATIKTIAFDTTALKQWDSAILVFVLALRQAFKGEGQTLDEAGLPPAARRLLALTGKPVAADPIVARANLLTRVGRPLIRLWASGLDVMTLVGETVLRSGAALASPSKRNLFPAHWPLPCSCRLPCKVVNSTRGVCAPCSTRR